MKSLRNILVMAVFIVMSCNNIDKQNKKEISKDPTIVDSSSVNSIFAGNRAKKVERFEFSNNKGFFYKGKGGTVLIFPPNSFDCANYETVQIDVAEYTNREDIVKSNLSTTSNGKLIETNGMVYCKAYDKNKKELKLKKGKTFTCMFDKPKKKGYMLFEGKEEKGVVNWVNPIPEKKAAVKSTAIQAVNSAKEALFCGAYGTQKEIDYLESALTFTDNSLPFFTELFFKKYNLTCNDIIPLAPDESVTLDFVLTKEGKLQFINSDMPFKQAIKSRIIRWFEEMPTMVGFTDKKTNLKEDLTVYFILTPNDALAEKLRTNTSNMALVNKAAAEKDAKEKAIEAARVAEELKQRKIAEKAMEEYYKTLSEFEKSIIKSNKIAFESKKMGWINCDRFYSDPRQKINLQITNIGNDFIDYKVQLIYTSINSMFLISSNLIANNVPVDENINIVFIGHKKEGGIYFYSKKIMTTKELKEVVVEPAKINASAFDELYSKALI